MRVFNDAKIIMLEFGVIQVFQKLHTWNLGAIVDQGVTPGSKIEKKFLKFLKNDIFRGNFM